MHCSLSLHHFVEQLFLFCVCLSSFGKMFWRSCCSNPSMFNCFLQSVLSLNLCHRHFTKYAPGRPHVPFRNLNRKVPQLPLGKTVSTNALPSKPRASGTTADATSSGATSAPSSSPTPPTSRSCAVARILS